ncbi:MAG: carbohydrate ABC transporter permease [Clostridia bacterium]|nr:carbohydrate ABC transporter permease [Clostridia bacterium]MBR4457865.1 carbohydrate ABC transporter permease [Clostridia bacterium]
MTAKTERLPRTDRRSANKKSGGYLLKAGIKKWTVSIVRGLLIFGLCFMIIQPMLTRFGSSLMQEKDLYDATVVLLPRNVTLENYKIVADLTVFPQSMLNTLWTSLIVSVLQVIACTLVGYGFARYEFPLKRFWFACVVLIIVIPPQTIATPLYMNFRYFDIFGIFKTFSPKGEPLNLLSSIVPYLLMSITCMGLKDGLYIYMLRQYFNGIPKSLEEAAYVDGCSTLRTFRTIMLPDAMPTVLSCFLFSFVWQWTDLFYTRNFLKGMPIYSTELSSILTRMSRYFSADAEKAVVVPPARQQQLVAIGVLICCIPLIILYIFTQRTFVESIAMSGSKE